VTNSLGAVHPAPAILTQTHRRVARPGTIRRSNAERIEPRRCRSCGTPLTSHRQRLCPPCSTETRPTTIANFVHAGQRALAERRALGTDPAHGGKTARARGASNTSHRRAATAFVDDGSLAAVDFVRDIVPRLAPFSLRVIATATGLTEAYCSHIRAGRYVPHRRHWRRLLELASASKE